MMDVIPSDDIAESSGGRPSNGEDKSLFKGFFEQFQDFFSLCTVWQVGCPGRASVLSTRIRVLRPLYSRGEQVIDSDRAAVFIPGKRLPVAGHGHGAFGLGPGINPVEGVAYGTGGLQLEHSVDTL